MKILHIIPTYVPAYRYGGPIYSIHGLCKQLVKLGHEVHVYTTNVDGPFDLPVPTEKACNLDGVQVYYFKTALLKRIYYAPRMINKIREVLQTTDIVHLHSLYLWPPLAGARLAKRYKVPYILTPHGALEKNLVKRKNRLIKALWLSMVERKNIEQASGLFFTTLREMNEAKRFRFKFPPVYIVPNGIDFRNHNDEDGDKNFLVDKYLSQKKPYLLFVGRINWEKGLDRLIQAMAYIDRGIDLLIAGNDEKNYREKLLRIAKESNVDGRIHFIGHVNPKERDALMKNARLFILTSYSENFANVVLQAMTVGCPVFVTPEVGLAAVVKESRSGCVCEGHSSEIGQTINSLLDQPERLKEMGRQGFKTAREQFDAVKIAKKVELIYKQIIDKNKSNFYRHD